MNKNNRKKYIIFRRLQYEILLSVTASGVLIYLISYFGFQYLIGKIFLALDFAGVKDELILAIVQDINQSLLYILVLTSASLLLTWVVALYLSNRIAGPIYKINKVIDEHLSGNESIRIHTRKNDFFKELAEKINQLMDARKPNKSHIKNETK